MELNANQTEGEKLLLQQVAAGNEQAFAQLVKNYSPPLYGYVFTLTRYPDYAEEVVQDVFMEIWQARESLGVIRNFRSFIFVVSRNLAINAVKKMIRERVRKKEMELNTLPEEETDERTMTRLSLIEQAIEQLPPQQQKVWILSRREGKTYNDVALEMNLSRETVKKYLQNANVSIVNFVSSRVSQFALAFIFTKL